jgi:hypothetical protein
MTLLRRPLLEALVQGHSTVVAANSFGTLDRERVHEDTFLRVATALEHFLTDWLVRALADDPSYLLRRLSTALQHDADGRYVASLELENEPKRLSNAISVLSPKLTVEIPTKSKLRLQDARTIIGVEDSALSMRSFEEFVRLAEQLLAPTRKGYLLRLNQETSDLIDVTIKLRHAIAHRSDRAADDLNTTLQAPALRVELRSGAQAGGRITAVRVGRYLVAKRGGWMRSCWLLDDLAAMAYEVAKTTGRHRVICDCEAS